MSTTSKIEKLLKFKKKIRDRERRFKKMPAHRKRVAIAKDVIRSINQDKIIIPESGTYLRKSSLNKFIDFDDWDWDYEEMTSIQPEDKNKDVRDILLTTMPKCTACAIGSMFVCTVLRDDNLTLGEFHDKHDIDYRNKLLNFFDDMQLGLIESAFEQSNMNRKWYRTDDFKGLVDRAIDFGSMYSSDKKRMIAIMENIIAHNGEFVP
jgi:hypothetical protein